MTKIDRITVEMAREAYERTGLVPTPKKTLCEGCACPIAAVAVASGGVEEGNDGPPDLDVMIQSLGLDFLYASGFVGGFDGANNHSCSDRGDLGWRDGLACRLALV